MENEYGSVTITCKQCRAVHVLEDAGTVERMTGYVCPRCGTAMTGRELAWLKAMYYLRLSQGIRKKQMGAMQRHFNCKIDLGVHYK